MHNSAQSDTALCTPHKCDLRSHHTDRMAPQSILRLAPQLTANPFIPTETVQTRHNCISPKDAGLTP